MRLWESFRRRFGLGAAPIDEQRWVVLDVEASGLDPRHDRLLAIAAIAVHFDAGTPRIHLGDSFETVLRQPDDRRSPDKGNILLHGIGLGAQRAGVDPALALADFERWVGASPLLGFHATFDRALIDRACMAELRRRLPNPWLDLEPLAAVLHPTVSARALDEWLAFFGIECAVRHQAAADTLATAELMLHLWPALRRELPRPTFGQVQALAAQRRWVAR
jgi:DNA polymerase III subunit epsilon